MLSREEPGRRTLQSDIEIICVQAITRQGVEEVASEFYELAAGHTERSLAIRPRLDLIRRYAEKFAISRLNAVAGIVRGQQARCMFTRCPVPFVAVDRVRCRVALSSALGVFFCIIRVVPSIWRIALRTRKRRLILRRIERLCRAVARRRGVLTVRVTYTSVVSTSGHTPWFCRLIHSACDIATLDNQSVGLQRYVCLSIVNGCSWFGSGGSVSDSAVI